MGVGAVTPAVFFDRDGVLNEAVMRDGVPCPPGDLEELRITEGAREAVARIRYAGYKAIIVTNQPDVSRGAQSLEMIEQINGVVATSVGIDAVYTCVHDNADGCLCRKPKPGLILRAIREHDLDLARSFMVGDRWKDVACGKAAGCVTIFLDHRYSETETDPGADYRVASLPEAVVCILQHKKDSL